MKGVLTAFMVCLICFSSFVVPVAAEGGVGVDPATITGTLKPGETQNAQITVTLPGSVPRGDVVFVFDTTGSMSPVLQSMKDKGIQVMDAIRAVIPDTEFGAGSFMDYPHEYPDYYGYSPAGGYGCAECGDYAWKLDQDLTPDINLVSDAIKRIPAGNGGDMPQDYTRVIYESQFYSWRADAKKIYVIFGDAPPHAAPSGSSLFTQVQGISPWGGDPGRDEKAKTPDDLDYIPVVEDIAGRHISIVGVYCPFGGISDPGNDAEVNFRYMADQTDGLYMVSNPNTDSAVFANQILSKIQEMAKQNIKELGLKLEESEYSNWVRISEPSTDVSWPSTVVFNVAITPPTGTKDGYYTFHIDVIGDGVVLGAVPVIVRVTDKQVVTPIAVTVDIKPGSCPNSFNVKEKGVLSVAILGSEDLQVSTIDPESILLTRYGSAGRVNPIRWAVDDVPSPFTTTCSCGYESGKIDSNKDLTLKFDAQDVVKKLGLQEGEGCVKVTITGHLRRSISDFPGKLIEGSDSIRLLDTGHGECGDKASRDDEGSKE